MKNVKKKNIFKMFGAWLKERIRKILVALNFNSPINICLAFSLFQDTIYLHVLMFLSCYSLPQPQGLCHQNHYSIGGGVFVDDLTGKISNNTKIEEGFD